MADLSPDSIPQEMRDERRWVVWRYVDRGGKRTKVPYDASTARAAKVNDSSTWSDFETAMDAYENGSGDGVGFVLGDGWAGIDLDHVRTGGKLSDAAQAVVDAAGTYTEVSPSGSGVHMIVKDPSGYSAPNVGAIDGGTMEIYDSGRYFTVTGDSIGSDGVSSGSGTLQGISDEYMTQGIASAVSQSVYGHVSRMANNTMMNNAARDNVRWARVPTGAHTCAFCMLLASRGFVYHSEQTALFKSLMGKYHSGCDCRAAASFDDDPSLDGYDPDEMYDQYNEAAKQVPDSQTRADWNSLTKQEQASYGKDTRGGSDAYNNYRLHAITAQMREMYGLS